MRLSIVIVNYKTPALVIDCIRSILAHTRNLDIELIIVDNDSRDGSEEQICKAHPGVRWIQMGYNSGFARANNAGIRAATGNAVLLLNSDTIVLDQGISTPYELLMKSPYIACGVQLINRDGSPQISGNYFVTGYLNNLLPLPIIGRLIKALGNFFKVKKPHAAGMQDEVVEVDWINGAYLMVKRDAIDKAGLLDEDFFLYAEEAEWCSRLRKLGKLAIFAKYNVIHLQGESSNTTFGSDSQGYHNLFDKKGFQIMLSNFVRLRKQHGIAWYLFQLFAYSITPLLMFMACIITWPFRPQSARRQYQTTKAFAGNVSRLWKLTPIIIRGKPYFYKVL